MPFRKNKNIANVELEFVNSKKIKFQLGRENDWESMFEINPLSPKIELSIEVEKGIEPSSIQLRTLKAYLNKIDERKEAIYSYLENSFKNSEWKRNVNELKKMYYLSEVIIKKEKDELWVIMEPNHEVPAIFNFLPRFTFKDSKIIWSNVKNKTKLDQVSPPVNGSFC